MPTFLLEKEFRFEASHSLPNHAGKCRRLHGHSWRVTVRMTFGFLHETGSSRGMAMDYGELSALMKPLIEELDHRHLNDIMPYPTSEYVALWFLDKLPLSGTESVTVEETCTSRVTVRR